MDRKGRRGGWPLETPEIELLYFEGCPNSETARRNLWEALGLEGVEAGVTYTRVGTDEEARRTRFPGSPTVRISGGDAFPMPDTGDLGVQTLCCRTYVTPEGLRGAPTVEMLRSSIRSSIRRSPSGPAPGSPG